MKHVKKSIVKSKRQTYTNKIQVKKMAHINKTTTTELHATVKQV